MSRANTARFYSTTMNKQICLVTSQLSSHRFPIDVIALGRDLSTDLKQKVENKQMRCSICF